MVAGHITVTSQKSGEEKSYTWYSDSLGEYTLAELDRKFAHGTEVALHSKRKWLLRSF